MEHIVKLLAMVVVLGLMLVVGVYYSENPHVASYHDQLHDLVGSAQEKVQQKAAEVQAGRDVPAGIPSPAPAGQKSVYKCKDAHGRVSYTDTPCAGGEATVITVKDEPKSVTKTVVQTAKKAVKDLDIPMPSGSADFKCDGRKFCSQMKSCDEAIYFMEHCHGMESDGVLDGVPCGTSVCKNH